MKLKKINHKRPITAATTMSTSILRTTRYSDVLTPAKHDEIRTRPYVSSATRLSRGRVTRYPAVLSILMRICDKRFIYGHFSSPVTQSIERGNSRQEVMGSIPTLAIPLPTCWVGVSISDRLIQVTVFLLSQYGST